MPIGIRPINDFAFKKTFGSPENKPALMSLLNAILQLPLPIVDLTLENPFSMQDFQDDKFSILDIKAVDSTGAWYNVEMQLTADPGLVQRIVYYGCDMYAGQLRSGEDYSQLRPAYSICLLDGTIWKEGGPVHHAFRLTDQHTGRILGDTLEIHTLEFGRYNLVEQQLATASLLDCWIYWLLNAHQYDSEKLTSLLPEAAIQQATRTITAISEITENKVMYDSREKALRDKLWRENNYKRMEEKLEVAKEKLVVVEEQLEVVEEQLEVVEEQLQVAQVAIEEGKRRAEQAELRERAQGAANLIRVLQEILGLPATPEETLLARPLDDLKALAAELQAQTRNR